MNNIRWGKPTSWVPRAVHQAAAYGDEADSEGETQHGKSRVSGISGIQGPEVNGQGFPLSGGYGVPDILAAEAVAARPGSLTPK